MKRRCRQIGVLAIAAQLAIVPPVLAAEPVAATQPSSTLSDLELRSSWYEVGELVLGTSVNVVTSSALYAGSAALCVFLPPVGISLMFTAAPASLGTWQWLKGDRTGALQTSASAAPIVPAVTFAAGALGAALLYRDDVSGLNLTGVGGALVVGSIAMLGTLIAFGFEGARHAIAYQRGEVPQPVATPVPDVSGQETVPARQWR